MGILLLGDAAGPARWPEAKKYLDLALALGPTQGGALAWMGEYYFRTGDFVQAETYFKQAMSYGAWDWHIAIGLGRALVGQGKTEEAVLIYCRAATINAEVAPLALERVEALHGVCP